MNRVVFIGIETSIAGWWLKSYNSIKVKIMLSILPLTLMHCKYAVSINYQ